MVKKKGYVLRYKRREKGITNYKKRLSLLKSRKPRLVVRKSNKHITVQVVEYHEDGDMVITSANSKELGRYGWKFATSNIPSAYLTGYICGKKAKLKNIKSAIVDTGLHTVVKSSRIFAAVKGTIDAGLKIPTGDDIFEHEDRIRGEHIQSYRKIDITKEMDKIKNKIDKSMK